MKDLFTSKSELPLSILLPLLWLVFLRLIVPPIGENCFDVYYHISMADAGPQTIFAKTFPSMTMSVWELSFSDKELLYHVALWLVRRCEAFLGIPLGYPFNLPALLFATGVLASFVLSLRAFGVKKTLLPALALVLICPFFTNRLLMLRPHVPSIALMILALPLFSFAKGWKGALACLGLGALYSWTYSNPHFILIPAFCLFAGRLPEEGFRRAFAPVLFAGLGAVAAQILHPQFPNTLVNWYIQCVSVVQHCLTPAAFPFGNPDEMRSADLLWFIRNIMVYGLFAFNLSFFLALKPRTLPGYAQGVFATSAIFIAGSVFGIRAMEYACPFTILSTALLAFLFQKRGETLNYFNFSKRLLRFELLGLLLIAAVAGSFMKTGGVAIVPPEGLAAWAKESKALPEGTKIANVAWSDFTLLHYSLPQCRYLCGLDPMFAYRRFPERFTQIERFRMLELWLTPQQLANASQADFAYVRQRDSVLGKLMELKGYDAVYKGADGWLFKLPPPKP